MDLLAPVATVPPRASQRQHDQWHRHSLPSSNHVHVQPASPEVISSLISSLSANFDDLPTITSPDFLRSSAALQSADDLYKEDGKTSIGTRFRMDYGTYDDSSETYEHLQLHSLDAAISPIVPTSRPPSGLSSLTASKRSSINFPIRSNSRASQSRAGQEAGFLYSIGNLSIEPGSRKSSLRIKASEKRRIASLQPQKGQALQLSREEIREMDRESKQSLTNSTTKKSEDSPKSGQHSIQTKPRKHLSANAFLITDDDVHTGPNSTLAAIPMYASSRQSLEDGNTPPNLTITSSGNISNRMVIPKRDSSLRHSLGSTPTRRKGKPRQHGHGRAHKPQDTRSWVDGTRIEATEKVPDDPGEDEVSRRINELRALKELRRHQLIDDAVESPSTRQVPRVSVPSPQPSERTWLDISSAPETPEVPRTFESSRSSPKLESATQGMSKRSVSSVAKDTPKSPDLVSPVPKQQRLGIRRSFTFQPQRVTSPLAPISPDAHKRAFSNPLSQVIRTSQYDDRPSIADSIDDAVDNYLSAPRLSQKIHHPQTGRIISFSEVGHPDGFTVFCCVGMGLTRYLMAFYDELALTLKLRLITPDRPGVGESKAYVDSSDTPLGWPDDILAICQHLQISRFSLLAHSAGAIYALATALRMPQYIRGRIHLLAPWIPPSQMSAIGTHQEPLPVNALPYSQRILRSLPTTFLKAANSSFLSATSASITTSLPKSPRRAKRKSLDRDGSRPTCIGSSSTIPRRRQSSLSPRPQEKSETPKSPDGPSIESDDPSASGGGEKPIGLRILGKERQTDYDTRLTHAIWDLATTNANPAVDLLVCLERRQTIGFRYVDINKAVVIHHGTRDTRVPLINAKWLGKTMRKCEVRVLEGEDHGLMASAGVMGNVLVEIAKEWEDWNRVVQGRKGHPKRIVPIS